MYCKPGGANNGTCGYTCRTTRAEANRRAGLASMFRTLDEAARCYRAGDLGREQVGLMAKAFRNPRCGHLLAESEHMLLEDERRLNASQFANVMKHWLNMADAEGIRQRHDTLHENRDMRITEQFDAGFTVDGSSGPAQGALAKAFFEQFVGIERLADWEAARAEFGDDATAADLRRAEAQRRADAFINILLQAAAQPADAVRPEPCVNIIMSTDAYEAGLAELAGTVPARLDPNTYHTYQCETLGGTTLPPGEAIGAAMAGHIRRVVIGATQASITPWRHTQNTSANNGAPLCGKHNRHKERGYRTWKDPEGNWHIQRPDGTTITPAA